MKKNKKVTVTKAYIDKLKSDVEFYKKEYEECRDDRKEFREFFLRLLKDNVSMASKNESYSTNAMIIKLSRLLNNVENWYW